ncbi:MAG: YciI family protein [Actinomycetota bacterium]
MRYVVFVIDSQTSTASGDEMAAIDKFNDELRAGGHWVMAAGIGAPRTAKVIDNRLGAGATNDGSLFQSDDFYSGFWIIEAESHERATTLASAGSRACNRRVELRPFL